MRPAIRPAQWWALGIFAVLFGATWIRPQWPIEQTLHHSLTVLAVAGLLLLARRWRMPLWCFIFVLAFLALHTVAARWIYSYVPYDDWTQAIAGVRLNDLLGWERNNFDRIVHLSYGVFLAPVLYQYLVDARGWRRGWAAFAAVDAIVSTGALYELLEWGIAVVLAPATAEAYNGQQGDIFDPQKDMAIALLGAVLAIGVRLAMPGADRAGAASRAVRSPPEAPM
jgi:putative membrane protein